MSTKKKPKKKRLVHGKDFHGWLCITKADGKLVSGNLYHYKPTGQQWPLNKALKWIRVKFVEVKP